MPCNCDHLEPSSYERESQRAAQCLVYLESKMGLPPAKWLDDAAESIYGAPTRMEQITVRLCELCKEAPDSLIYNGKDPMARKLADWWDEHQEADKRRLEQESTESYQQRVRQNALDKLTDEEKQLLGV